MYIVGCIIHHAAAEPACLRKLSIILIIVVVVDDSFDPHALGSPFVRRKVQVELVDDSRRHKTAAEIVVFPLEALGASVLVIERSTAEKSMPGDDCKYMHGRA